MEPIILSRRLEAITQYISPYKYIADIGTDHCFVPIYLCQQGKIDGAIATDLRDGPIKEAKKNVNTYYLEDRIDVRKGDGLSPIHKEDQVDVIIIAGMGGRLIGDMLERDASRLSQVKRYILQPNRSAWFVRKWLFTHGFQLVDETIITDEGITYEIIVAEPTVENVSYDEFDILFGPILRRRKDSVFISHWEQTLNHKKQILEKLPIDHPDRFRLESEIERIEKVINKDEFRST